MKFFAVIPALLSACAAEASLPIASQYLGAAGLYNGYSGLVAGAYAAPYAAYGPAAVDAKFAYGAPITALNAGPLTAGPVSAAAPVVATAPLPTATYAAAYTAAPAVSVAATPVTAAYAAAPVATAAYAATPAVTAVAPAAPIAGPVASQFQAQDEFGNVAYGYQNINSAKEERGNANGGVTGSYTYQDEAGVHTVNYIADDFGFRVAGNNLPVAPVYNGVAPAAPVYTGVAPLPVADTPEVAAAKAEFFEAFNAATKTKRSADAQLPYGLPATYGYGLPATYGYGLPATYAAAPVASYAAAPLATVAAAPVATATYAAAPVAAAPIATAAYAAAPAATAAPAREAVLTTIKLNPGHATFYRVD